MAETFQIEDVKADPGEKKFGWLKLAKTYYGELKIPIFLVNGTSPGKTLFMGAVIHGAEYVGFYSMLRLIQELNPSSLRGKIIGIPIINIPAFEAITRESPFDSLNLNRIFPGKKGGYVSEQIANLLVEKVLPKADYVIDLHSAGVYNMQINICGFEVSDKISSLDMAKAFGIEVLWKIASSPIRGSITGTAIEHGIPAIIIEVGGEGRVKEEWVQFEMQGFKNVMKFLQMMEGKPEGLPSRYMIVEGFYQHVSAGGFLLHRVQLRDKVKKGDLLGTVIDPHGNTLEEIKANAEGLVMGMRTLPKINPGDTCFWVGIVKEEISN